MPSIADYLKYANLQMAAEAFIRDPKTEVLYGSGDELIRVLKAGNDHASKFPTKLAEQFAAQWEVVDQRANTTTGFSGTLFRAIADDLTTGTKKDDLVISFRSTEFVDDSARDNQSTNVMEVKKSGFAFGQIADMEKWYAELKKSGGPLDGKSFSVTGYSLGGNLATAFNILRREDVAKGIPNPIQSTYTFNGAGVGDLAAGASLTNIIENFKLQRDGFGSSTAAFTDPVAKAIYDDFKSATQYACLSPEALNLFIARTLSATKVGANIDQINQLNLLSSAMINIRTIQTEVNRIATLSSGDGKTPKTVLVDEIAQTQIDYQLAVLNAAKSTSSYKSGVFDGFGLAYAENRAPSPNRADLPPFFDLYGAPLPSAVANSQWHYGDPTPIYIEDQPLMRGDVIPGVIAQSGLGLLYGEVKLLVDKYSERDFGDTHSLVLLVDSLSLMNAFATLDPKVQLGDMSTLFKAATASKAETVSGGPGKAEGDSLEAILDAFYKLFTGADPELRKGKPTVGDINTGNTWADENLRKAFYDKLSDLQTSDSYLYKGLVAKGGVTVDILPMKGSDALASLAGSNSAPNAIAYRYALKELNPFAILGADDIYAQVAERLPTGALDLYDPATGQGEMTQQYLIDRAKFLAWKNLLNTQNVDRADLPGADDWKFNDLPTGRTLWVGNFNDSPELPATIAHEITFGGDTADTLTGGDLSDNLYGGAGDDTLSGGAGDDYLEGNAGADKLAGGEGRDNLQGGSGNDTLNGGLLEDTLMGGLGDDTYVMQSGDGWDWIEDTDGQGHIEIDGATLGSGTFKKIADNTWQETLGGKTVTYSLSEQTDNAITYKILTIQIGSGGLRIKRWQPGQLGIKLPDAAAPVELPVATPTPQTLKNDWYDQNHTIVDGRGLGLQKLYAIGGEGEVWGSGQLIGNETDNYLHNGDTDDELYGNGGKDTLIATGGNDKLYGGEGDDALSGGDGNDLLDGGSGDDVLAGGDGGSDELKGGSDRLSSGYRRRMQAANEASFWRAAA